MKVEPPVDIENPTKPRPVLSSLEQEQLSPAERPELAPISEHDEDDFVYDPNYLGIRRSDDLVMIQLTVSNTRPREQKKQLYRRIVEHLTRNPGLRAEDILINLVEVLPENWSFGNGEAQYVK